ncbi:AraC family transcriptional regulator [Paenibacillus glycanilyticus]|uniref:AraC family transcriptional regulator n=1 Tax=Paenibacillus glycanilyticus TaxID=126569 RepID=UPI0020411A9D|nr:AraC family transcriptional regulator [Paenibacillus glycanilyticus]MCM3626849.1 AraC family transcriptional regulator [Paenibacillus glycanilyticus]
MNNSYQVFESQHFLQDNLHMMVNRFTEDFLVPYHAHDFIEFSYVAEGTGFHHIGQDTFPIHKGMLFVIPIGAAHVFRPASTERTSKPPVVYNCLFDLHLLKQLSVFLDLPLQEHLASLISNASSYYSVFDRDGSIERIMLHLFQEMSESHIGSKAMLYALLNQLIVTVYRLKFEGNETQLPTSESFHHVMDYIEQNFNRALTLSELSRVSGWSSRQLQRLFAKYTDQTFGAFLQSLRIRKSCELLRGSSHKIAVIAELVGYTSIDSFNIAFKKNVGLTPTEYRKSSL